MDYGKYNLEHTINQDLEYILEEGETNVLAIGIIKLEFSTEVIKNKFPNG